MDNIYERLIPIFQEVFDNDDIVLNAELSAKDVPEWDSLSHIRLMVSIERTFNIRFATGEITSFKNIGELVSCLKNKISGCMCEQ